MTRILLAILFFITSLPVHAACDGPSEFDALPSERRAELEARAANAPFHEGILWQAKKNGHTSYIVGTMHIPDPRHSIVMDRLTSELDAPEQLFMELSHADQQAFQHHLTANPALTLITDGPSLIDRLGDENWAKLQPHLSALGLPGFVAANYQPWFLGMTLSIPPCAMTELREGKPGLDRLIELWSTEANAPVQSLDNTKSLLDLLASDPLHEQVSDFKWSLSLGLPIAGVDSNATLTALYFQEKIQLFWEYTQDKAQDYITTPEDKARLDAITAELQAELINARNLAWVDTLAPELAAAPAVVAVGALHLPGDDGVLNLLSLRGFALTRVPLVQQ
ncbi:TraB/GumN family protein [Shimia abyssi]|uniref:TraB family protein n=1 Tax=Shimia abyssi TaxID=1662395 RepID=A0A2P8F907_9RHOB|nr:TraB/GumN family protein [Shimia abyssi]PSL18210.1 hypothetical protein CLV88_112134 [Shimia abyssi]